MLLTLDEEKDLTFLSTWHIIKSAIDFFIELEQMILKFSWESQSPRLSKRISTERPSRDFIDSWAEGTIPVQGPLRSILGKHPRLLVGSL